MKTYPEHEKLKLINEQSQWLGDFIEWAQSEGMFLAEYEDGDSEGRIHGINHSINDLLAKYFKIDLIKIENEKRDMIEECRKLYKTK